MFALLFVPVISRFVLIILFCGLFTGVAQAATQVPENQQQITLSFAPLVRKAAPAVVNIYTQTLVVERQVIPLFRDPFFRQFFGERFGRQLGRDRERVQNSLGSGVIVQNDGVIVTNNHVIEGADKIRVVLSDRREFDATIIGVDESTDLAVLKIEVPGEDLPFMEFRDSDDLLVGDLVIAIGNPFGVGQTVTSGIVSAVARSQVKVADVGSFIQTDAAINPGNSGGALISMDGRLAGINTAIFSNSGGSLGIGFAVPSNMVRFVVDGFVNSGSIVRPWLGAWGQPVTSDLVEVLGLDRPVGVLVNDLWPGGSAAIAGIEVGDVILGINGQDIYDANDLQFRIASLNVGGTATISLSRDNEPVELEVPLEQAPEVPERDLATLDNDSLLSGSVVANMSPALAEELRLSKFSPGVIILDIIRNTNAAYYRFQPGDLILELNDESVTSVDHLVQLTDNPPDINFISISRQGERYTLKVRQ